MSDESESWNKYKEFKRETFIRRAQNTLSNDRELMESLKEIKVLEMQFDSVTTAQTYVLYVSHRRGTSTVDFNADSREWKARNGRAKGLGIYSMARYYGLDIN
ncbi:MAG: hypothetical protein ACHQUC_01325 [Chlamydiales bacterium]